MAILSQIGLALERDTQLMASAQELRRLDRKKKVRDDFDDPKVRNLATECRHLFLW